MLLVIIGKRILRWCQDSVCRRKFAAAAPHTGCPSSLSSLTRKALTQEEGKNWAGDFHSSEVR